MARNPWVELAWAEPIRADRIVLYDRTARDDANGGTLQFSDGSTVAVRDLPADGDAKVVTFPARTFDRVRFQVQGGSGPNVGLLEFEVFAVPRAPGRRERVTVTTVEATCLLAAAGVRRRRADHGLRRHGAQRRGDRRRRRPASAPRAR